MLRDERSRQSKFAHDLGKPIRKHLESRGSGIATLLDVVQEISDPGVTRPSFSGSRNYDESPRGIRLDYIDDAFDAGSIGQGRPSELGDFDHDMLLSMNVDY